MQILEKMSFSKVEEMGVRGYFIFGFVSKLAMAFSREEIKGTATHF